MIRAGIVGLGYWGQTLVDSVCGRSETIRFVAGTTRTPSKVTEFATRSGIRLCATLDDLLADYEIDAVVLATPHSVHFDQIMKAVGAGKHVYCEKPFCLTSAETATALAALEAKGLKVAIGHNRRFFPNTIALKRIIDAGELGDPVQIEGNFSFDLAPSAGTWRANREESPAGGMTSLGIHVVDIFIHLFGRIDNVLTASRRIAIPFDIDDATLVLMQFEGGQLGCLGTVASTAPLWQIRAFGTGGWGEIFDDHRMTVSKIHSRTVTETWINHGYPCLPSITAALEAFAAHCEGGAPFPVSPDEIQHATDVLEAIVESAATGQRVSIASLNG